MSTNPSLFHTRSIANEGIDINLSLPDGTETGEKIRIRGVDSEVFRQVEVESRRRAMELAASSGKGGIPVERQLEERLTLLSALVISWTFEQPCTQENVKAFLREAPQVADQIDSMSAKRSLFFKKSSAVSSTSPSPSSS